MPNREPLTWEDLDRMVEGDPLVLRDRAWDEINRVRAASAVLTALEKFLALQDGRLIVMRDEHRWTACIMFGAEADDSPMAGGEAWGIEDTMLGALRAALAQAGVMQPDPSVTVTEDGEAETQRKPWRIDLPPEPPRDRVIEARDADGKVKVEWKWDGEAWLGFAWHDVVMRAMRAGWSLRSVPAEGGEPRG